MRLIDADALVEKLLKLRDTECGPKERMNYRRKYRLNNYSRSRIRITADIRMVRQMPTIKTKGKR